MRTSRSAGIRSDAGRLRVGGLSMADETRNDPEQPPFEVTDVLGGPKLQDGIGLCLSGGGFRAMLFHLGSLIRLNEVGLLPATDRISSVSGGSLAAGIPAAGWAWFEFGPRGGPQHFPTPGFEPPLPSPGTRRHR